MGNEDLQKRILSTYNSLRFGMFVIAVATPFVIVLWPEIFGVRWQNSISEYYFAPINLDDVPIKWAYSFFPGRILFGGILFALGAFLFLYKGFSRREDIALNLAGAFAVGVAMFPMRPEAGYIPFSNVLHFTFAVLLFVCMAYTAIFCHDETLRWLPDPDRRARYRMAYRLIGWFMALFPVVGLLLAVFFEAVQRHVFWIEAAGIWSFAAYWLTKTFELKESEIELKAVTGRLTGPPPP